MTALLSLFYSLPILSVLFAVSIILLRHSSAQPLYIEGVSRGLSTLKELVAPMLMLCISVRLIGACGICDDLSVLLSRAGADVLIPESLLPLIITRPISGAASNAALSELISSAGADSFEVFCAAVIMSSGDTCLYIHSTYFSVQTPKKAGAVLLLMLLCSVISAIICIFICRQRFI